MAIRRIGVILNGVTGRMGTNQHLVRSILAIMKQGGVKVSPELTLMPDPILTGRSEEKLKELARTHKVDSPLKYTTDVPGALDGKHGDYEVFFDASGTRQRAKFVGMAVKARRAVYCEKPTAVTTAEALRLAKLCEDAAVKNGVVQDKLFLPGLQNIRMLKELSFFGNVLSVKGDFGYWVFTGVDYD